jgi:hypothetical protein
VQDPVYVYGKETSMRDHTQHLLDSVLELPDEERAALLDELFRSFSGDFDPSSEPDRVAEAESRIAAHEDGKLASISEAEAYARLGLDR